MKLKKNTADLLRIGIFFLGISALMFAGIAIHWYYTIQVQQPWKPTIPSFWARCEEKTIVIEAMEDLRNITVKDTNGNMICEFNFIHKGSDEICFVNTTGLFVVEVDGIKKVVTCREISSKPIVPLSD